MTKFQTLSVQIQSDLNDLAVSVEEGAMTTEEILKAVVRLHEKVKEWAVDTNKIIEEAERLNNR